MMACDKPLASWKTWWSGSDIPATIAQALFSTMDPTKLPGGGKLVVLKSVGKPAASDLDDPHTGRIVQALLDSYPATKDPSAYLLGDTILCLNSLMGETLLGPQKANPFEERVRRDDALKQGGILKLLLSYTRNSSARHSKGRSPNVTFLKELALAKGKCRKLSVASPTSSTGSAETLLLEGIPLSALDESPTTSSENLFGNIGYSNTSSKETQTHRF